VIIVKVMRIKMIIIVMMIDDDREGDHDNRCAVR